MTRIVLVTSNDRGFAELREVRPGTTIREFFHREFDQGSRKASPLTYIIRINGRICTPDYFLNEGDVVTIVPLHSEDLQ